MSFEYFISKRFLKAKKESKYISIISMIAMLGVALGVAVLIIALAVINGFKSEIEKKLTGFSAHIDLTAFEGQRLPQSQAVIDEIKSIAGNEIKFISPYVGQLALILSSKNREGVWVKGILPESDYSDLRKNIIKGSYQLDDSGNRNNIIIGKKLAVKLGLQIGDRVNVFALNNIKNLENLDLPNIENFYVSGIYESGISDFDDLNVYINLNTAQNFLNFNNSLSGYDIMLNDAMLSDFIADALTNKLGYPYYAKSIFKTYRNIFTWIELQRKPIPIVLGLIIIVAVFNVISTLLMLVLEKTNAIGILKSIGASIKQIKKIFLINGLIIGVVGTIVGNILSLILILLQKNYEIIKLPEGIYFIDKVPFEIIPEIFLITSFISISLSLVVSLIPASLAGKSDPIATIRFS